MARKVHGIEPEKRLISHFQHTNLTVYQNLSEIPYQDKYDIITLFHVLEHLPDPKTILAELSKFLKEEGKIIIEVPNSDDALLKLYQSDAFSDFTYWSCHLFLFNTKTLEMLCSQAGFQVDYIQQVQRYPLSNHLHWLAKNKPGGHSIWSFLDSEQLNSEYANRLASLGMCDTLIASLSL